jgi:hypothetical protein
LRMQKALTQMNVQLANVLSDISGVTGQAIIKAIRRDDAVAANNLAYLMLEHDGNVNVALTLAQTARRAFLMQPTQLILLDGRISEMVRTRCRRGSSRRP